MKFFTIEREAFLIWRFIQFWIFLCIFILETIQLFGYSKYYLNQPANEQLRVWVIEGISFAIIAYILAKFNHRWNTGPVKDDILLDWSLLIIWTVQCFLNVVPAIFGRGLDCNIETSPYNITTHEGETRCRLFIGSTALSFVALSSTFVTLMLTIIRWKNKQLVPSSIKSYNTRSQKSFLIQEGSLDNGEPVLFFYSRNRPLGSSIHGKIIRNPIVKTARTSISSPINITISEPEMAAAAALKYDDVPNVTVHDDGKNENEKDNSVLRY